MDIIKSYKKNVVENRNLIFAIVFIICLVRLGFYSVYDQPIVYDKESGYLWTPQLIEAISNSFLSFILSFVFTLGVVIYSAWINSKYKLIRSRTYLVYVFALLLFSCHPVFIYASPQYIALLLLLACFDILLGAYQRVRASGAVYSIGFLLGIASLFTFHALVYLPLFWVGTRYMRCLNLKTFLASLLGLVTVYWLVFSYFLWQNDIEAFLTPFERLYPILNSDITQISADRIVILWISGILLVTMIISYWSTSFQDKIQTRTNLAFIFIVSVCSFLAFIFISYDPVLNLFVFVSSGTFLLAHFFTLADQKWKVHMFYILMILYCIVCAYFLLNRVITPIFAT